jgi:hypothetical protein
MPSTRLTLLVCYVLSPCKMFLVLREHTVDIGEVVRLSISTFDAWKAALAWLQKQQHLLLTGTTPPQNVAISAYLPFKVLADELKGVQNKKRILEG